MIGFTCMATSARDEEVGHRVPWNHQVGHHEISTTWTLFKTRKHVRCKPHVCPHRIPHIAYPQGNAQIPAYGLAFFTFQYLKTQKPKPLIKTLNPKKPQVKIAAYSQCFHSSSGDSLWYCLGMFFGLWRTWGLAPTCLMAMYLFGIGVFPNFGLLNTQYSSNEWRC